MTSEQYNDKNHTHEYILKEIKKATCEEDGWEKYVCQLCQQEEIIKTPALGHLCKVINFARTKSAVRRGVVMKCMRDGCSYEYSYLFQNKVSEIETGEGPAPAQLDVDYFQDLLFHFHCGADISKVTVIKDGPQKDEEGKFYLFLE